MVTGYDEQYVSMWIDFNDDAVFSSDELVIVDEIVNTVGEPVEIEFTIPADANLGAQLRAKTDWQISSDNPWDHHFHLMEKRRITVNIVEALTSILMF